MYTIIWARRHLKYKWFQDLARFVPVPEDGAVDKFLRDNKIDPAHKAAITFKELPGEFQTIVMGEGALAESWKRTDNLLHRCERAVDRIRMGDYICKRCDILVDS